MSTMVAVERARTIGRTGHVVPRLLGAAFLIVILTSLAGGLLLGSALGGSYHSDLLSHLSTRVTLARAGALVDLVTSCGIVALAGLLYVVLHRYGRIAALVALGFWLLEAMFMAVSRLGALALVRLSQSFVAAGTPAQSAHQVLGESLYKGVYTQAYTVHMFFYCIGGLLWYALFYRSRVVPRLIALFGLVAAALGFVGIVAEIFGATVPTAVFLPLLGFELAIGVWLVARGIHEERQETME